MKCIHCGTDSRLRDRPGSRCPRCRHPFAFEPARDSNKVTDGQFNNAVDRVSEGGRLFFTRRQLWYEFNRRWMKPRFLRAPWGLLPLVGAGLGFRAAQGLSEVVAWGFFAALGAVAGIAVGRVLTRVTDRLAPRPPRRPRIPFDVFTDQYLPRWRNAHGDPARLLPERDAALAALPTQVSADVAAFSFDRVLVTDTWETAQMLVANRFHFEHNCAVLSRDGYPGATADTVKKMLRRNPALTVFALHNATPSGCLLPLALREPEWFPEPSVRIVDLGLRPETVRRLRIPSLRRLVGELSPRLDEILPPRDVAWLNHRHAAELAALRPAQLLRAAYRGIVAERLSVGSSSGSDGGGGGGGGGDTYHGGGIIWIGDLGGGGDTAEVDGFG